MSHDLSYVIVMREEDLDKFLKDKEEFKIKFFKAIFKKIKYCGIDSIRCDISALVTRGWNDYLTAEPHTTPEEDYVKEFNRLYPDGDEKGNDGFYNLNDLLYWDFMEYCEKLEKENQTCIYSVQEI